MIGLEDPEYGGGWPHASLSRLRERAGVREPLLPKSLWESMAARSTLPDAIACSQCKEAGQDANGISNPINRITIAPAGNRLSNFDGGPKNQKADQHRHPP